MGGARGRCSIERSWIARSVARARGRSSTKAVKNKRRIVVSEFIAEIGAAASLGRTPETSVIISPVPKGLVIEADHKSSQQCRKYLAERVQVHAVDSTVTLSVRGSADRVLIAVHDECGGLPGEGEGKELIASFEQRGADRSGLGIGLAFSRWGAEANGGRLYARNLPGMGCVFTVDLPRASVPAAAAV